MLANPDIFRATAQKTKMWLRKLVLQVSSSIELIEFRLKEGSDAAVETVVHFKHQEITSHRAINMVL